MKLITVLNTFGYTDQGNLVREGEGEQIVSSAPAIVGYSILNSGDEILPVDTAYYYVNDNRVIEEKEMICQLYPGAIISLRTKYLAILALKNVNQIVITNGELFRGGPSTDLDKYYFVFNPPISVYQPGVFVQVGIQDYATKQWYVRENFNQVFGCLNKTYKPKKYTKK